MRTTMKAALLATVLLLPLTACKQERADSAPPAPLAITADAVGRYCGMNLHDHPGPKGQIIVKGEARPIWLSSVRDTFAFTMLPEEPKEVRAIYVTDLTRAADPQAPDLSLWVEARKAWYVVGSGQRGGMGASEPLPFADEAAARAFANSHGGTVKRFSDVTPDEILTPQTASEETMPPPAAEPVPAAAAQKHGSHGAHQGSTM
ncbi:nitrous oxide reductase accessory protein NosL [Azospirillum thermophilum]|uniref:Copper resistance protein CopZ n=1 Tax=Azospirillum thermophilum TaxID=2202148 RepID=A0A2S2CW95_9PROT|nr:nitrous oxide reductase accessory protein NosL [Azospirillum thermophilum]AWK88685.1 copper resistance protein CopZ [Azospirillum thermophilum]